jgi:hypothetical protein
MKSGQNFHMLANKIIVLFLLVIICGATPASCADQIKILDALFDNAKATIPEAKLHCEIPRKKQDREFLKTTLEDVLVDYIYFSLKKKKHGIQTLNCTGEKIQDCTFEYGNKRRWDNPGWQIFLKFKFNSEKQQILTGSIECIQVP